MRRKYVIMHDMKYVYVYLLVLIFALSGCWVGGNNRVVSEIVDFDYVECADGNGVVKYSTPNGNDLMLETDHHIIQIDAQPNVQYEYRVWVGDKTYETDPDLVITDGTAYILQDE